MKTFKLLDTFLIDGYYVTQNYYNNQKYYAQFNLLGHEGVDFGHKNKLIIVRSPIGGTVFVAYDKNYGWFTVVEDYEQGCAIYICHGKEPVVVSGEIIKAGDPLIEMDDEGNANGEHVHFNFVILNEQGSNKYHNKNQNWGYLDPRYPRDTGAPVTFAGVEQYEVQWVIALDVPTNPGNGGSMPANFYPANEPHIDLNNQASVKVAIDIWVRLQKGEFVDKSKYEKDMAEANNKCNQRVSAGLIAQKQDDINEISRQLELPTGIKDIAGLVSAIKKLIDGGNSGGGQNSTPPATLPPADKLKANGLVIEWEADGKKYKLNHSIKE